MSGYVVTVAFDVRPGDMGAFLPLVTANARTSVKEEPGCRQFDVVTMSKSVGRVFLYEVYDDEAAFEAHKKTAHFVSFDREGAGLVLRKDVFVGELQFGCSKD